MADELFTHGLVVKFNEQMLPEIIGCPDEMAYRDFLMEYASRNTPVGMLIMEGAETQLFDDLHSFLKQEIYKKMKVVHNMLDDEEREICANPEREYDIEVDGI